MKISVKSLEKMKSCEEGIEFFKSIYGSSDVGAVEALLKVAEREPKYSVWWLTQTFTKPENVELVIFTARMVLPIFEEENPKDDRPRKAIEAAEKWLDKPTEENRLTCASASAATAAYSTYSTYAAFAAAAAAATAAYSTYSTYAAFAAAAAAAAAAYAAAAYATYADATYADAYTETYNKIISKGIEILERRGVQE